eukprot:6240558-Heterocapsa_arctica.AAC.1
MLSPTVDSHPAHTTLSENTQRALFITFGHLFGSLQNMASRTAHPRALFQPMASRTAHPRALFQLMACRTGHPRHSNNAQTVFKDCSKSAQIFKAGSNNA